MCALLPGASRNALWTRVVSEDASDRVLSPAATAAAAAQAEVLLHDHVVDADGVDLSITAETRAFDLIGTERQCA